jgi:uncharacterized membrane protein
MREWMHRLSFEWLEDRTMLDSSLPIVVGRTLSVPSSSPPSPSYFVGEVQKNQVTITYTVYNEQADPETGVMLTTSLEPGVTLASASPQPDISGANLAWSLGTIQGYDRASVSLTVNLASPTPLQLDTGAHVFATLHAGAVSNSTPAATLRPGNVDPSLLASTPDANTTDPFVQNAAAALGYDPNRIFDFLHSQIGYNAYVGSVRGARGTLWSAAGNALDVASLGVALMRASGIPAQYVSGTLSQSLAQQLILSMFPAGYQTVGYVSSGTTSDPADDSQLLSETEAHDWFQFDPGTGMRNADPLMAGAAVGQAFTSPSGTFAEVPDALREKTEVMLNAELFSPGFFVFGGGLSRTTVLDQTFNDVDLVGHPLTFGNFVNQTGGGFIFTTTTTTYSPYVEISDEAYPGSNQDEVLRGKDYQEVVTNFPFGSQILTGLFLDITLSGPEGPAQSYERALVDRLGAAVRQNGGAPQISINPNGPPPLTSFDAFTLIVSPGEQSHAVIQPAEQNAQNEAAQIQALSGSASADASDAIAGPLLSALNRDANIVTGVSFLAASDGQTGLVASSSLVKEYTTRPRLTLMTNRLEPTPDGQSTVLVSSIDLRRDTLQAIAFPGQAATAAVAFNILYGLLESQLESEILAPSSPPPGQSGAEFEYSAAAIYNAAMAQGIPIALVTSQNLSVLDTLSISDNAKALITTAVGQGLMVFVPSQSITVNGQATVAWYEVNPSTGETVGVTEDGGHQSTTEKVAAVVLVLFVLKVASVIFTLIAPEVSAHIEAAILQFKYASWEVHATKFTGSFPYIEIYQNQTVLINAQNQIKKDKQNAINDFAAWAGYLATVANALGANVTFIDIENTFSNTLKKDLRDIVPNDPPIGSMLVDPTVSTFDTNGVVGQGNTGALPVTAGLSAGDVSGTDAGENVSVSGNLSASWSNGGTSSFSVSSLSAATAVVTDVSGKTVGTGAVALSTDTPIASAVTGNGTFAVKGDGLLAFYVPIASGLAASGDWTDYAATVTGQVSITLTSAGLTLNGQALPAGTYTVTTTSVSLAGSGPSTSPAFAGSASVTASAASVDLGPGTGSVSVGGKPLDPSDGVSLTGYSGSLTISPAGAAVSTVFQGSAGAVLSVPAGPTLSADQNAPVTFPLSLLTSLSDSYNVTVVPPPGWTTSISSGRVTVTPAPGLPGGTYPIQFIAQSQTDPALIAQGVVNVTVTPTQPGITLSVAPDSQFTVPFNGAEFPTAFRASIQNLGPAADTYNLTFSNVPSGFTLLDSGTSVTVPPGQTGIVGLYLQPNNSQALQAPGTVLSFTVTATSTTTSSLTKTQIVSFTVPQIDAVTVTSSPTLLATPPGTGVTETLTFTNVGNVPETVALTDTLPAGLSAGALTPLTLAVGQSMTEKVTLTPASSTPLNSLLLATITATYGPSGSPQTQDVTLPVQVSVPGAAAIASAAAAAGQLGKTDLANRLDDLSKALTNLVQTPTSAVAQSQVQASLTAVNGLLGADPLLASFVPTLTADGTTLARATTAAAVQAAVMSLGNDLGTLATTLADEPAHRFTLGFVANSAVGQPQAPTTYQIVLQNTGSQKTTYDLSVSGLPSGVNASFSQPTITLNPGQVTPGNGVPDLTLMLTSGSATALSPFNFTVTATAEGAPEITQSVTGSFTVRQALVQVTSVTPNPTFTNPGGQVDVQARILNAVNRQQQAEVSYTVTDANGRVLFTSTPVTTTLNVLTTLTPVDLGKLDTTNFALGDDTITVTVSDAAGNPIPGATGKGTILIGTPVTATLATSPSTLPAGNGTVTTTLQLNSQTSLTAPLSLAGQAAIPGASGVAVDGTLAYVGIRGGIDVVDISDPTKPKVLSTFGIGDFPSTLSVEMQVYNNELVVLAEQFAGTSDLLVYSLATPASPTLLGKTPLTLSTGNDLGLTLSSLSNNHVYTGATSYRYFIASGQIFAQFGESLDIDISNPTKPTLVNEIYNDPPSPSTVYPDGNSGYPDGTSNVWQSAPVNAQTLLIGTTTATMGTVNSSGVNGLVMVVDTTDPSNPSILEKLAIPGMAVVTGIVVQGNQAFVLGSSQNWGSGISGLGGNVVVATLNLTNPRSPTVVSTQTLATPSVGISYLESLGNGRYVTSYFENAHNQTNTPSLLLLDASNPQNVVASVFSVPAVVSSDNYTASGNFLFTADGSNLLIYNIGQAVDIPVTAQVTVPTNDGVSIVPNSFNIAPTTITTGTNSETLTWNLGFSPGNTAATFTWQSAVTGLKPAETETIAQGGTVSFVSQGTPGTVTLPAQSVTGEQIIGLSPATRTVAPGAPASYTVTLDNPTNSPVTYNLSVQGVPSGWVNLAPTATVGANSSTTVTLVLTSDPFAATGDEGFSVSARGASGATASVQGDLVLQGQPTPPDPQSHGIVATLTPAQASAGQGTSAQFVVQLTNTGSTDDTFSLTAAGLPSGVSAKFGETTIDVPPGASNFRDVTLTLTPKAGTTPGAIRFQIIATSTTKSTVSGTASGMLTVVASGVGVTLSPASGAPGSTFQMTVKNTGSVTATYDLALAGPAALVTILGQRQVTLAPEASQVVLITTGAVNFADQGPLNLTASATLKSNPAVAKTATATLNIPATQGLTAQLSSGVQVLHVPGTSSFLLLVNNAGNTEDSYTATITGTKGPVTASLTGLDGLPTQTIPTFILPGLSTGAIVINTDLMTFGQGSVTVQVQSLTNKAMSASATATVTTTVAQPTKTVLGTSANSTTFGQSVTFTAAIGVAPGVGTPTGTVTFTIDGKPQTPVPLQVINGVAVASFRTSALSPGAHTVSASYSGNATFVGSTSRVVTDTVNRAEAAVALVAAPNPAGPGQPLTFTAVVAGNSAAAPSGRVIFLDGTTAIGTAPLHAGQATLATTLGTGTHRITAVYAGDVDYAAKASPTLPEVVTTGDGPTVTNVQRFGFHAMPTSLVLTFSTTLDPARAQDVSNYQIVNRGGPGRGGNRIGKRIAVSSAIYDPTTLTVTLYPAEQLDVHNFYRLTVIGTAPNGLTDTTGLLLDGAGTGKPGSDFVTVISRKTLAGPAPATVTLLKLSTKYVSVPTAALGSQRAKTPRIVQGVSVQAVDVLATSGQLSGRSARSKEPRRR